MLRSSTTVFLLLLLVPVAVGIGLRPGRVDMNYIPGFEKTFNYHVSNTLNIPINAHVEPFYEAGRFEGSLTISKTDFDLGPYETQSFFVTMKLPQNADAPGENRIGINAYEVGRTARRGAAVVQGAVGSVMHINGLYAGKYLELSLNAGVQGENQPVDFQLTARSLGTEPIEDLRAKIEVYELPANALLTVLDAPRADSGPLTSWYSTSFAAQLSGDKMRKGLYRAVGTVYYDGEQKQTETYFRIGQQGLTVTDFPRTAIAGQITRFPITVESQYNFPYENVEAEVTLKDGETLLPVKSFKTEPAAVQPFEKKELLGYLDLGGVSIGIYSISIIIRYGDELLGVEDQFTVTDAEGNSHIAERVGGGFVQQAPRKPILTTTNILIGVIVILITINVLWFVRTHRKPPIGGDGTSNSPPGMIQKSVMT